MPGSSVHSSSWTSPSVCVITSGGAATGMSARVLRSATQVVLLPRAVHQFTPSSIFEKDIHLKVANRHLNRWKSAGVFGGYAWRFRHSLNANAFSGLRSP